MEKSSPIILQHEKMTSYFCSYIGQNKEALSIHILKKAANSWRRLGSEGLTYLC